MADNELIINNSVFNNRVYAKELRIDTTSGKIYKVNDDETEIELDDNFAELVASSKPIHIAVLTAVANASTPTADKLSTARTIGLTGAVTGTPTAFDGSQNITIPTISLDASLLNGIIPSSVIYAGNAASATEANKLSTARSITLTDDITGTTSFDGSANVSISTALANSGVTADTYGDNAGGSTAVTTFNVPKINVDAKGRITSAQDVSITVGGGSSSVEWSNINNKPTTLAGYGISNTAVDTTNSTISIEGNQLSVASLPIQLNDANQVSGILPIANGGTGVTTLKNLKTLFGSDIYFTSFCVRNTVTSSTHTAGGVTYTTYSTVVSMSPNSDSDFTSFSSSLSETSLTIQTKIYKMKYGYLQFRINTDSATNITRHPKFIVCSNFNDGYWEGASIFDNDRVVLGIKTADGSTTPSFTYGYYINFHKLSSSSSVAIIEIYYPSIYSLHSLKSGEGTWDTYIPLIFIF